MTTMSEVHNSATCDAANGNPCQMCAAAIAYETQRVIDQVHEAMAEDCDCAIHRLSRFDQTARFNAAADVVDAEIRATGGYVVTAFDDDWELAPLSMTRTTEQECAEYWYEQGRRAERRKLLTQQNADMREMLRVGNERIQR